MRLRPLLAALLGALALPLALAGPASAFDGSEVMTAANAVRGELGVGPLREVAYAGLGGAGDWQVLPADGDSALDAVATWPELLAVLLDPRTTAAATASLGGGGVSLALATSTDVPLVRAVVPAVLDPASPIAPTVLLASRPRSLRLFVQRGATEVALPLRVVRAQGEGGAWLAQLDGGPDGVRIGYSGRYRLEADGMSWSYATRALPAVFLARTWTFGPTIRPRDRQAFLRALATAPLFARRLIAQIDGAVRVERRACDNQDSSCAEYDDAGAYSLSVAPADFADTFADLRFVTFHEFAHLVDYLAFDQSSYAAFRTLFRKSPRWRSCFADDTSATGCVEFAEILADQFAYWATGLPADPSGGYGDPPLAARAAFEQLLRAQWLFRPPLFRNPAVR